MFPKVVATAESLAVLCTNSKKKENVVKKTKSRHDPVVVMKFEFCAHSAKLLRKHGHVLLWILSHDTGL